MESLLGLLITVACHVSGALSVTSCVIWVQTLYYVEVALNPLSSSSNLRQYRFIPYYSLGTFTNVVCSLISSASFLLQTDANISHSPAYRFAIWKPTGTHFSLLTPRASAIHSPPWNGALSSSAFRWFAVSSHLEPE